MKEREDSNSEQMERNAEREGGEYFFLMVGTKAE